MNSARISDPNGMHARPAVAVSKLAKRFESSVEISVTQGESWINAKSTNAVMKLKAEAGTELLIRASGGDATVAVGSLVDLVNRAFED